MLEHMVSRDTSVGASLRPREAGARGGQRLEPQGVQIERACHIPGVWNDEAARLVQLSKCAALVGDAGTAHCHLGLLAAVANCTALAYTGSPAARGMEERMQILVIKSSRFSK